MSTLTRKERGTRPLFDLFDWMDMPWTIFQPLMGQSMRMEDFVRDGHYVIRAELPGIDPEREVDVCVDHGVLSIKAERREEEVDKAHSEFRYGTLSRRIVLPAGADTEHIQATYDKGILEVVIDLPEKEAKRAERHIPVKIR